MAALDLSISAPKPDFDGKDFTFVIVWHDQMNSNNDNTTTNKTCDNCRKGGERTIKLDCYHQFCKPCLFNRLERQKNKCLNCDTTIDDEVQASWHNERNQEYWTAKRIRDSLTLETSDLVELKNPIRFAWSKDLIDWSKPGIWVTPVVPERFDSPNQNWDEDESEQDY